jgi:hypothetical protein
MGCIRCLSRVLSHGTVLGIDYVFNIFRIHSFPASGDLFTFGADGISDSQLLRDVAFVAGNLLMNKVNCFRGVLASGFRSRPQVLALFASLTGAAARRFRPFMFVCVIIAVPSPKSYSQAWSFLDSHDIGANGQCDQPYFDGKQVEFLSSKHIQPRLPLSNRFRSRETFGATWLPRSSSTARSIRNRE